MADIKAINRVPEDTREISCTSSGSDAPPIPRERSRLLVTFVVVMGLMFVWGVALLPAIFYANKLPAPPEPHINTRYELIIIFCFFFKSKYFYFYGISIFHLQGLGETIARFFVKAFTEGRGKGEWGMGNGKRKTAMEVWEQVVSRTLQQNALHISKKCNIRSWSLLYFLLRV